MCMPMPDIDEARAELRPACSLSTTSVVICDRKQWPTTSH